MANNTPIGNMDFVSHLEAVNALQRNPQIAQAQFNYSSGGTLTTNFSASTIYGVVMNSGSVTITAGSSSRQYSFVGPTASFFPLGMPTLFNPPGGACSFVVNTSTVACAVLYK